VQYTFSLIFITATLIGYTQYKNFLRFDLGFTTENVLNIKLQGNKGALLEKELSELPDVREISKSLMVTSLGSIYGMQMKYNSTGDSAGVWLNFIDEHYLPLHSYTMIAGKNFSAELSGPRKGEESEVIVNEQVLKRFGIGQDDPNKALGEIVKREAPKGRKKPNLD